SLAQFWQAVARLGGFIGRKSDGQPGWQTLWRGWLRLQDLAWGQ
ncbi:IS4 family transposase, partial [Phormidesmis priestleyi ANT.L61.2]